MATTIRLFRASKMVSFEELFELTPEKLFQLDDIEAYLSNKNKITISNYQYVKFELEMTLKLNLEEFLINPNADERFVYLAIHNPDMPANTWIYYFIKDFEWRSEHCVAVNILCDVLNTFAGRYEFNKHTIVKREHRNRFERANIVVDEGIFYSKRANHYFHISQDEFPSTPNTDPITFSYPVYIYDIYKFNPDIQTGFQLQIKSLVQILEDGEVKVVITKMDNTTETWELFEFDNMYWKFDEDMTSEEFNKMVNYYGIDGVVEERYVRKIDRISENINPVLLATEDNYVFTNGETLYQNWYLVYMQDTESDNSPVSCYLVPQNDMPDPDIQGIDDWDRTEAKLIKIIELPYCPVEMLDTTPIRPNYFERVTTPYKAWKLRSTDRNKRFVANIPLSPTGTYDSVFKEVSEDLTETLYDITPSSSRLEWLESKMYHSEFYMPKFFYDSFSLPIICENLDIKNLASRFSIGGEEGIKVYTTGTMNSRFAFKIEDYIETYRENDYPQFLMVARNNELPLYNSAYLNYIRTGYNYDVKNKNASTAITWLGVAGGLIGTGASIGAAVATGGIAVPLAVGMGVSTFMSLTNAINTTLKNERNIQERLEQLKNQSLSVSGSDDIDLLNVYNKNKLLYNVYKPSEEVEILINDLFYFTGYATNRMGAPYTNSRLHFNFVQCEPVLDYKLHPMSTNWIKAYSIPKSFQAELEKIMRNGYTILHKVNDKYDFKQTKENIEVEVYNYYHGGN